MTQFVIIQLAPTLLLSVGSKLRSAATWRGISQRKLKSSTDLLDLRRGFTLVWVSMVKGQVGQPRRWIRRNKVSNCIDIFSILSYPQRLSSRRLSVQDSCRTLSFANASKFWMMFASNKIRFRQSGEFIMPYNWFFAMRYGMLGVIGSLRK